jgi:drug/metabolite transporter (DMT)-like permease
LEKQVHGVILCVIYNFAEAWQSVYLAGVFQEIDSFVLTAVVFGLTALTLVAWDAWANKTELLRAVAATRGLLLLVNISTAICWITYFSALKMIEPTVAFTMVSGTFPLSIAVLSHLGANGTTAERNLIRTTGNVVVAGALIILAVATLSGNTGLAGPAGLAQWLGIMLAVASGISVTWTTLICRRLHSAGMGPELQFALRFVLYIVLAGIFAKLGLDFKPATTATKLMIASFFGLCLIAAPIYFFQRAIRLVSPFTIGVVGAFGPLNALGLEALERRMSYSFWTLLGVTIYGVGALTLAVGAARSALDGRASAGSEAASAIDNLRTPDRASRA